MSEADDAMKTALAHASRQAMGVDTIGKLRLVLDAALSSDQRHSAGHAKAALARLLDELGAQAPALVRGDCGYGLEDIIDVCERREQRCLLRLRRSANVKRLLERLFQREDRSRATEASQGDRAAAASPRGPRQRKKGAAA
ncbi:MAG: transposase [Burkholderiales bacterium]|jgi:hypothetical protein|nr:transposase [Burkholderiales bacterium]